MIELLFGQYADYPTLFIVLELIAVSFGVVSVLLASRLSILVFPVGIISTAIFVYLLWQWQLFGDMLINAYYTAMSVYGWLNWSKHQTKTDEPKVEHIQKRDLPLLATLGGVSAAFVALVYYFRPVINNHFSFEGAVLGLNLFTWVDVTDMLTTALFLIAMWLMARRKIEHWLVWIVADTISVPLYFYKGYTFTALQYVVLTLIAIKAYYDWKQSFSRQSQAGYA